MKTFFCVLALALRGLVALAGSPVDDDWKQLESLRQQSNNTADQQGKIREAAWTFYASYPEDPRRWQAAYAFVQARKFKTPSARDAFYQKADGLLKAMMEAKDLPPDLQEYVQGTIFARRCQEAKTENEYEQLGPQFSEYLKKFPSGTGLPELTNLLFSSLGRVGPYAVAQAADQLQHCGVGSVADVARTQKQEYDGLQKLASLRFTAADGREIDVGQMRGKVVLIDFWATWCGPCRGEIPNVRTAYDKLHDQGFEVIGVALEQVPRPGTLAPEARAQAIAEVKAKLLHFVSESGMPWPQYFDGDHDGFGLIAPYPARGIPFTVLIDRRGRVAALELRGPNLIHLIENYLAQ